MKKKNETIPTTTQSISPIHPTLTTQKNKNAAFPQTTIHSTVKQASQSVCFNDQPQATLDRSENYPFLQQNKNITNKHQIRNQPHYSEDEELSQSTTI